MVGLVAYDGRVPSVTCTVLVVPPRRISSVIRSPGFNPSTTCCSSLEEPIELPFTFVITSPARMPALAAGVPLRTLATRAPPAAARVISTPR